MTTTFQFHMPTRIMYGPGASGSSLGELIASENILIISDPFLYKNGTAQRIGEGLSGRKAYFSNVEPNPSCDSVDEAARLARDFGASCIIGLGGGSAMDIAKIVACLATNPGSIYDYFSGGTSKFSTRTAQLVLIPTTAGTGSEVTNVGVYTDHKKGRKLPMVDPSFWADIALVDPELTHTMPKGVTASTGIDAFAHAIESYWNQNSNPLSDMLGMKAMKLVMDNLRTACTSPDDIEARGSMSLASVLAGVAFGQTRTTGPHAIGYPLTTDYGLSHGEACALTLPAFIKRSHQKREAKMKELATFLGFLGIQELAEGVESLMRDVGLRLRLSDAGVTQQDLDKLADIGLSVPTIFLSPAEMNKDTVMELLQSVL